MKVGIYPCFLNTNLYVPGVQTLAVYLVRRQRIVGKSVDKGGTVLKNINNYLLHIILQNH